MASIELPISNDKILALLAEKYGLEAGRLDAYSIDIVPLAPTSNSTTSHLVRVSFEYPLDMGDVEKLVAL